MKHVKQGTKPKQTPIKKEAAAWGKLLLKEAGAWGKACSKVSQEFMSTKLR